MAAHRDALVRAWHHQQALSSPDWPGARFHLRRLLALDPDERSTGFELATAWESRGQVDNAIAAYEEAIRRDPNSSAAHHHLARLLATCSDPRLRDTERAVSLARSAVTLAPRANVQNTLGVALYRSSHWKEAIAALETAMKLRKGDDGRDGFLLAMAQWQLGDREAAHAWYDKAVEWMQRTRSSDKELIRFRTEAADLLGVPDQAVP